MSAHISNVRPKPDAVITDIADYAAKTKISSAEAYNTARLCLMDTLGCGFEALSYPWRGGGSSLSTTGQSVQGCPRKLSCYAQRKKSSPTQYGDAKNEQKTVRDVRARPGRHPQDF